MIRDGAWQVESGHQGQARYSDNRRQRNMAGIPSERTELLWASLPSSHSHQGFAKTPGGLWQVFSIVRKAKSFAIKRVLHDK